LLSVAEQVLSSELDDELTRIDQEQQELQQKIKTATAKVKESNE
jgi:hypothetical protein